MADYDLLAEPLTAGSFETGSGDIGDIFILNRALERVGIVSEYNSLVWTSRLWDHSEATMKCSAETALPTGAAFLQRSDSDEVMRIRRIHYRTDEKGTYLEVGCKGATTFFKDRVNWWTKSWENENLATAAYELAEDAQATYQGIDRTISGMAALADLTGGTHLVTKQTSWGDVADPLQKSIYLCLLHPAFESALIQLQAFPGLLPEMRTLSAPQKGLLFRSELYKPVQALYLPIFLL
jgi:hypothetical protein